MRGDWKDDAMRFEGLDKAAQREAEAKLAAAGYCVEVVDRATEEVVHKVGKGLAYTAAEKTERGMSINLDHGKFYTRITRTEWEA
jgi:hypothetical protein